MIRDSSQSYGIVTIFFHWVSAGLTLFLFGLGVYLTSYGYYAANYMDIAHLHYALGIILLGIVAVRLLWRLTSKTPTLLADKLSTKIAITLIKVLLYISLLIILVSGYLICTAEGQTINVFALFQVPSLVLLNTAQVNIAGLSHKYIAWALFFLVVIHASAALIHHFFVGDKTLVRMIKPTKNRTHQ